MKKVLTEKYRPKEFEDVIGLNPEIASEVERGRGMQHLLFHGPAGTGKTTTAFIILEKLGVSSPLLLNASDERGINTIRDKVKSYAQTTSVDGNVKAVFLDEADALTSAAQNSLRNLMESYVDNCKFILTCNYINKIIDPIKSRCKDYQFQTLEPKQIMPLLKRICEQEQIQAEEETLMKVIDIHSPDIRRMVNFLQGFVGKSIPKDVIQKHDVMVEEMWRAIKTGNRKKARQMAMDSGVDYSSLLVQMFEYIRKQNIPKPKLAMIISALGECNRHLNNVVDNNVEFFVLIDKLVKIIT